MKILFFDVESTGLPLNWRASMHDLDNWPRCIQLSYIVSDEAGRVLRKQNNFIYPDGWKVPEEKFWIENGHSTARCSVDGIPMDKAIDLFLWDYNDCDVLVSHNMEFDFNVIGSEMIRYGKKTEKRAARLCTKELGTNLCKLPGNYGKYKWPKLSELHQFLFNKDFDGAHDALSDVIALRDCFFELVKREVIKLNLQTA